MAKNQKAAHDITCDNGGLVLYNETQLNQHIDEFAEMLKDTQEYKDYIHMVEVLQRNTDLYDQVMLFRKANYFLQHAPEHEDIYDRVEDLRKSNAELLDTPEVYDFLMAEWTFFHMMQSMFDRLMNEIDF